MRQPDLFNPDPQGNLFDEQRAPVVYRADAEKVRRQLLEVLAQVEKATSLPWSREKLRYHQTVFPQMSQWLPEEEAAQLRFAFDAELKRLLAA
jgi:hypothetical protein